MKLKTDWLSMLICPQCQSSEIINLEEENYRCLNCGNKFEVLCVDDESD